MRYHLNITDGHGLTLDLEGADLPDLETAKTEALASVRQMMSDSDALGLCRRHWQMDVIDAIGRPVFSLQFAHALKADRISLAA